MSRTRPSPPVIATSRRSLLTLAGALGLSGCARPTRLAAVPRGRASAATILGVPNERFFPLERSGQAALQREFVAAARRYLLSRGLPDDLAILDLDLLG